MGDLGMSRDRILTVQVLPNPPDEGKARDGGNYGVPAMDIERIIFRVHVTMVGAVIATPLVDGSKEVAGAEQCQEQTQKNRRIVRLVRPQAMVASGISKA